MYPVLFEIGFIKAGSYGLMLFFAIFFAYLLFARELKLRGKDRSLADDIALPLIPAAIIGSKFFHILDHWDSFIRDPKDMIFSASGLSFYGGLIFVIAAVLVVLRIRKEKFFEIADIASPSLAAGYCFGRFGCHFSGDGCYGLATSSFLGTAFPNGIYPTSVSVYPTPLIEVFMAVIIFGIIMQARKKIMPVGNLFFFYVILNGISRFAIEFIRRNPKIIMGLSQAQLIALCLIFFGIAGIYINRVKTRSQKA